MRMVLNLLSSFTWGIFSSISQLSDEIRRCCHVQYTSNPPDHCKLAARSDCPREDGHVEMEIFIDISILVENPNVRGWERDLPNCFSSWVRTHSRREEKRRLAARKGRRHSVCLLDSSLERLVSKISVSFGRSHPECSQEEGIHDLFLADDRAQLHFIRYVPWHLRSTMWENQHIIRESINKRGKRLALFMVSLIAIWSMSTFRGTQMTQMTCNDKFHTRVLTPYLIGKSTIAGRGWVISRSLWPLWLRLPHMILLSIPTVFSQLSIEGTNLCPVVVPQRQAKQHTVVSGVFQGLSSAWWYAQRSSHPYPALTSEWSMHQQIHRCLETCSNQVKHLEHHTMSDMQWPLQLNARPIDVISLHW